MTRTTAPGAGGGSSAAGGAAISAANSAAIRTIDAIASEEILGIYFPCARCAMYQPIMPIRAVPAPIKTGGIVLISISRTVFSRDCA